MENSLKFTIDVHGLDIPEKYQAEISKALNQTLMHKLGELDLVGNGENGTHHKQDTASPKASGGNFIFSKYLINGGLLARVLSPELFKSIQQVESQNKIPTAAGELQVQMFQ